MPVVRLIKELLFTAGAVREPLPEIMVHEALPTEGRLPVKMVLGVLIQTDWLPAVVAGVGGVLT